MAQTENEWRKMFANNLRDAISEFNYTKKELADDCNVDKSVVNRYLNSGRMPSVEFIIKSCYCFGIDADEMINYGEFIK